MVLFVAEIFAAILVFKNHCIVAIEPTYLFWSFFVYLRIN